jgi:hypothetical protein
MWSDWIALISGGLGVVFTVIGFFVKTEWLPLVFFILAIASFFIASFRMWYKIRPQLIIDLERVTVFESTIDNCFVVTFECQFVNTKIENNTIRKYNCIVNPKTDKYKGKLLQSTYLIDERYPAASLMSQSYGDILYQGIPASYCFGFSFNAGTPVLDKDFVLELVDSYNETYKIVGRLPLTFIERTYPYKNPL